MRGWGSIADHITLRDKTKAWVTYLLGQVHMYHLTEKPIVIFATRRGGSTLLAEMIASQPGVDCLGEPLNLWRYRPYFNRLPHPLRGRFISLNEHEARQVRSFWMTSFADGWSFGRLEQPSLPNPGRPLPSVGHRRW